MGTRLALTLVLACLPALAAAQSVALAGSMGNKALLVVNGSAPRAVAVGAVHEGVKVLRVGPDEAVVEVQGRPLTLQVGGSPVNLGGAASTGGGRQIVMTAGSGGHFVSSGSINGRTVTFMVDTGATTVAISQREADRIGLAWRDGQRGMASTANGQVPLHRVRLNSIRIGDVQVYEVDAVVLPASADVVLLGNSFLGRFQMRRDNDRMTLDKR